MSTDFSIRPVGAPAALPVAHPQSHAASAAIPTELPPGKSVTAADASAAAGNDLQNQNPLDLAHQILHDLDALSVVYQLVNGNADEIVEQHPEEAALRRRAYFHELDRKRSPPRVIPTDVTA